MDERITGLTSKYKKIDKLKYFYHRIKKHWNDTNWWKETALPYLVGTLFYKIIKGNKGTFVMNEDWDNLIILDACRYDTFREVTGSIVDHRISRGSATSEFLIENFSGKKYNDTVIVTAHPYIDLIVKDSFYEVISVWKYGWNEELNTVLPQTIADEALRAEKRYPNKRLIIWFMQPHYPFIGNPELCPLGYKSAREYAKGLENQTRNLTPWQRASRGEVGIYEVWAAYKENLKIVVPFAFKLAQNLRGKTVITSDHGNALKNLFFPFIKIVGHPDRIYIPELIKVPWLEFKSKERKQIEVGIEEDRVKRTIKVLRQSKKL